MRKPISDLFDAFRKDHAVLGRGLYEVALALRGNDFETARNAAGRLDREAGPHMAFEEQHFYPALRRLLGNAVVDRLYAEHGVGLAAINRLRSLPKGGRVVEAERAKLLENLELMQEHVSECGELFGALGRISPEDQEKLLDALLALRKQGSLWSELASRD
jgi:hypothetical protein